MRTNLPFILTLLALGMLPTLLSAQTETGSIIGTVTDETGAVVPGVTVTLVSEALITETSSTVTDEMGAYKFIALRPGMYDVTFELTGFRSISREGIRITANFVARVDATMSVAGVEETVTVTGESPAVDTKSTMIATSLDQDLLDNIPSGRDIWVLTEQTPGTVPDRYNIGGTESAQQTSLGIHGAYAQQDYSINGLSMNWPGGAGQYTMFYFDYDSFQEVQIQTSAASAEVSVGGLYMNMITKSGGNTYSGGVTFMYQPGELQGNNVTDELKAQGIEKANPVDIIYDFQPSLGGPIIKNKMWFFGSYRRYVINTEILGMRRPDGSPELDVNHQSNVLGKVTAQIDEKNQLMAQYYFNYQNRFYRREGYNFIEEKASWRQIEPANLIQGQWTSVLSDDLFLDVRYGYLHQIFPLGYQPEVGLNDFAKVDDIRSTLTGAAEYDMENLATRSQANVALSYFAKNVLGGNHDFKFGFEYMNCLNAYDYNANGDYVLHFFDGVPTYVLTYNTTLEQESKIRSLSFYAQDSYTLGDRFTVNLGLRYDGFKGWNPAQGSPGGRFYSPREFGEIQDIPNFGIVVPRIGASYDVRGDGRTAIKGSFSRYAIQEGSRFPETLNPNAFGGDVRYWTDVNGDNAAQLDELGPPVSYFGGASTVRLDPDITRPYSDEATLGVQHQLGKDLALGITYYYRKNKNLLGQVNEAVPVESYDPVTVLTPEGEPITVYNQDPATLGLVDRVITNMPEFWEKYHGIELNVTKRFSDRWQLLGGYTYGRNKSTYVEVPWSFVDANDPNNLINIQDRSTLGDVPHIFKLVGTYVLPADIAISANYRFYTGKPIERDFTVSGLNQVSVTVPVEPRGTYRYSDVSILDLRVSKTFNVNPVKIEAMFNLFNAFNASTVINQVTTLGPYYGTPSQLLTPIMAGFGMRVIF